MVTVFGYSSVGFLSIWGKRLNVSHVWLPLLAAVQVMTMVVLGLFVGKILARNRGEQGLFGLASGVGNAGFTMGGFVVLVLFGESGLALVSIYGLMWTPLIVLFVYPIARHWASDKPEMSVGKLMRKNILDWRSISLPIAIVAVILSINDVARPGIIVEWRIIDILVYTVTAVAYFAIGLRLHLTSIMELKKQIASLAIMRFVVAAALGLTLVTLAQLSPWPLTTLARKVFLIEAFVPVAITVVAVANMFHLKPREASALFVANTFMYLLLVLPIVIWIFGG